VESVCGGVVAEAGEEPVESGSVCRGELGGLMQSGVRRALALVADKAPAAQDE